jgi:hypothetical protein
MSGGMVSGELTLSDYGSLKGQTLRFTTFGRSVNPFMTATHAHLVTDLVVRHVSAAYCSRADKPKKRTIPLIKPLRPLPTHFGHSASVIRQQIITAK